MELDMGGWGAEDAESGGSLSHPGWYRCVVDDVAPDELNETTLKFSFRVSHGPWKGSLVYDRLYDPSMAEDEKKSATSKKRAALFAHRLGLWDGEKCQTLSVDFTEAIGTECVLQVQNSPYKDKQTGLMRDSYKPTFNGIFDLGNEKIPAEQLAGLGLPARPGTPAAPAAATASDKPASAAKTAAAKSAPPAKPAAAKPKVDYSGLKL